MNGREATFMSHKDLYDMINATSWVMHHGTTSILLPRSKRWLSPKMANWRLHGMVSQSMDNYSTICFPTPTSIKDLIMHHFKSTTRMESWNHQYENFMLWNWCWRQAICLNTIIFLISNILTKLRMRSEGGCPLMGPHFCQSFLTAIRLWSTSQQVRMNIGPSICPLVTFMIIVDECTIMELYYWAFLPTQRVSHLFIYFLLINWLLPAF